MFDRQTHLLEALRTLSTFPGETKTGSRVKDEPRAAVRNFVHSYSICRRLFADHLKQVDSQPIDALFDCVKDIEAPAGEAKPLKWLHQDVQKSKFWKQLRALAGQGALLVESWPALPRERPVERLPLSVVRYDSNRVDNDPPDEDLEENEQGISTNDVNWYSLREDLLNALEKHGLTAPDDPADDPHFYLVDDRYNDERYHYLEVYQSAVLTLNWLKDLTDVLQTYSGWGVGVKNLRNGYLLIFADRLLVTGPAFHSCEDVQAVLAAMPTLI